MELKKNRYEIDGIPVVSLAEKHGSPLYIYESAEIIRQYKRLTDAFKSTRVQINYACKALTNINILKLFRQLGSGLDAVSIQEVTLGSESRFRSSGYPLYTQLCFHRGDG